MYALFTIDRYFNNTEVRMLMATFSVGPLGRVEQPHCEGYDAWFMLRCHIHDGDNHREVTFSSAHCVSGPVLCMNMSVHE